MKDTMSSLFIMSLWLVGTTVESFSTPSTTASLKLKETMSTALRVATLIDHENVATDFWGKPRSEQEIIDFVSDKVFNNDKAVYYASSQRQDQWVEVISAEPPLLIVHGFLEHEYCDQIIDTTLGPSSGSSSPTLPTESKSQLKRSTMGAEQDKSDHRTSSTAWLHDAICPLPLRTFATRTAALSGLPPTNMENLQVVRYQPGEEFQLHTDHLDSFNEFDCGGRSCTCLVYLNDSEQSAAQSQSTDIRDEGATLFTGGETAFPEFDVAIPPKKGSALFFWNTLEKPGSENYDKDMFLNVDIKLRHAGKPVLSGEKWVANRWVHPRSFGANVRGLE